MFSNFAAFVKTATVAPTKQPPPAPPSKTPPTGPARAPRKRDRDEEASNPPGHEAPRPDPTSAPPTPAISGQESAEGQALGQHGTSSPARADTPVQTAASSPPWPLWSPEDAQRLENVTAAIHSLGVQQPEEETTADREEYIALWVERLTLEWKQELSALMSSEGPDDAAGPRVARSRVEFETAVKGLHSLQQGLAAHRDSRALQLQLPPLSPTSSLSRVIAPPSLAREPSVPVTDSIVATIFALFCRVAERKYLAAEEEYFKLTIGSDSWHLGTYSGGIHVRKRSERLQRSKLQSSNCYLLHDPRMKAALVPLKQLINVALRVRPPIRPSL